MIDPTLSASLSMIQAAPCSGWKDVFKRSGLSYIIKALAPEKKPWKKQRKDQEKPKWTIWGRRVRNSKKQMYNCSGYGRAFWTRQTSITFAACLQLVNIHLGSSRHTSLVSNPWEWVVCSPSYSFSSCTISRYLSRLWKLRSGITTTKLTQSLVSGKVQKALPTLAESFLPLLHEDKVCATAKF